MPRQTSITVKFVKESLAEWQSEHAGAAMARQAEESPVQRDMMTLLLYTRDHKVVGNPKTGNMPLKNVREVTAQFVDPPKLEVTIGTHTDRIRSEEQLWPLHFLRVLAEVGGLLNCTPLRRRQLTKQGTALLEMAPLLQAPFLLAIWWYRVNWIVAYPYTGMGKSLPYGFTRTALAALRAMQVGTDVSCDKFTDALVARTGLTWGAADPEVGRMALRGAVNRMVISVLEDFGAVKCKYRKVPLGRGTITERSAFKITPWGMATLDAVAAIGGEWV